MPPPGPGVIVDDDIDTCLRVLAQASKTDPGDPRWARVHQAAAQVYRAGKKARKTARHADRQRHDRELLADSTRYREQEPPPAAPVAPGVPSTPDRRLLSARRCYVCKRKIRAGESRPLTGAAARIDVAGPAGALELPAPAAAGESLAALFPAGRTDETGQPLDLRSRNSWSLRLHEVDPAEWVEVHVVNAFAPFLLTSRLRGLLEASPWPDRYVVQVSAMEGSFSRENKTVRHPHTNMAKASLNMLTRTAADDYAASGVYMNSVDTGWVTDERPHPGKAARREAGFRPPLDVIDGAARIYDPIVRGVGGERIYGMFLKDYRPAEW